MDTGLTILRALLAVILFMHATQKLYGWFAGNGLTKQSQIFASLGLRPGKPLVVAAGTAELIAAALLVVGLFTPVAALLAAGTLCVAGVTMHLNSGSLWNIAGGGEYPYVLAVVSMVIGFTGAGSLSADTALFGQHDLLHGLVVEPAAGVGVAVVTMSIIATVPFVMIVRWNRTAA